MEIIYFDAIDSTHKFLVNSIKSGSLKSPVMVVSKRQEDGVGSRGNRWISLEGNLFLSFCVNLKHLPKDLPIQSTSIYFAYILKEILDEKGSEIWVKWPNDFYLGDKKSGGVITVKIEDKIVCSIGLNLKASPPEFAKLDIVVDRDELIKKFVKEIEKKISWKQLFSKYKLEFQKSKKFYTHYKNGESFSLKDAILNDDGSVCIGKKRIYSQR